MPNPGKSISNAIPLEIHKWEDRKNKVVIAKNTERFGPEKRRVAETYDKQRATNRCDQSAAARKRPWGSVGSENYRAMIASSIGKEKFSIDRSSEGFPQKCK